MGGGGVSRLLVDPRPPQRLHYPLDLLRHPAGCPSDHPVPVLPLPLDVKILEPPAVEGRNHSVPQIFRELVGADRPLTPVQNGILDPPHEPRNGGGVDVEACLPGVRVERAQRAQESG